MTPRGAGAVTRARDLDRALPWVLVSPRGLPATPKENSAASGRLFCDATCRLGVAPADTLTPGP
jgi:hypothetical protein